MLLAHSQQQLLRQEQSILETGFSRYQDYIFHGDKHDVLERYLADRLPELFVPAKRKLRMLDIGAGTGRLTRQVLNLFRQSGINATIVALEPSSLAAKQFHLNLGEELKAVTLQKRPFLIGSPLERPPYDFVMAVHVCYYFDDKNSFVQQVMHSLVDGGVALFVGTSITIMQNELYKTILPRLRADLELPRTFHSDGHMDFAEDVEKALFEQNIICRRDVLPSHITFSLEELATNLKDLQTGNPEGGPVLKAMSFLWRFPVSALLREKHAWISLFSEQIRLGKPLRLDYEDIAFTVHKTSSF